MSPCIQFATTNVVVLQEQKYDENMVPGSHSKTPSQAPLNKLLTENDIWKKCSLCE